MANRREETLDGPLWVASLGWKKVLILGALLRGLRNVCFFRVFCLVPDRARISESRRYAKPWQDIGLEQKPDEKNR
jgi:hypothetical protein